MLSPYFKLKVKTEGFKQNLENIIEKIGEQRVVVTSSRENFVHLDKIYHISKRLNISAIVSNENIKTIRKIKVIKYSELQNGQFDAILELDENAIIAISKLEADFGIDKNIIFPIFVEEVKDERQNILYLYKRKFDKTLPKMIRRMKHKKVILYGAGAFLEVIYKYFDLSKLNIIGVADKKYSIVNNNETFLGHKTYNPAEIADLKPDVVLVSTKIFIPIFEYLHFYVLKGTGIKIKPIVKRGFFSLLKEFIKS